MSNLIDAFHYCVNASKRLQHLYGELPENTVLVKITLTLMDYFSPAYRRTSWVTD
jgi:hypothetical protein